MSQPTDGRKILDIGIPYGSVKFKPFKYDLNEYAVVIRNAGRKSMPYPIKPVAELKHTSLIHGKISSKFSTSLGANHYEIKTLNEDVTVWEEDIVIVCEGK